MAELRFRNPCWTDADMSDWESCWAELWSLGTRWEWTPGDVAYRPGMIPIRVSAEGASQMGGYLPMPDTACLVQLWAAARSEDLPVTDGCYYRLEALVQRHCGIRISVS